MKTISQLEQEIKRLDIALWKLLGTKHHDLFVETYDYLMASHDSLILRKQKLMDELNVSH